MTYGRETMINLTKVHRIVLQQHMVHFIYATPEFQMSTLFSSNNFKYTYCFANELRARKVYEDIQITLAKNGQLADMDGMLK
jgi:hypothetical protein